MSPRIATGLAALAAFVAAGSAPAWADAPEAEPSASASASPTAERSPVGPSASPSPSPSPSPDASPSTERPGDDDGADAQEPSPDMEASQDGDEASPDGDEGDDGTDDRDGDPDDDGADPLELEGPDPEEFGDHVAELDYVCTLPNDRGTTEQKFLWSAWAVPEDPTEGQRVQVGAVFAGDYSWLVDEDGGIIEADAVTETGTVELGGRAAPQETMDFTVRATRGDGPFGLEWDFDGSSAETTPERAGSLTFTPGAVQMVVEAEGDKSVTECAPAKSVDPLLELTVAEDGASGGDGGGSGGGDDRAAGGNGRSISTPLGDLPVTGPALLGLAGAGAVSLGAGSTAMYLARKRPGADD